MKTFAKLMMGSVLVMGTTTMYAQNPHDEEECANGNTVLENNSLYTEYAKQKNFAEAYEFWKALYDKAPDYNKNIYVYGENILKTLWNKEKDDVEKRTARLNELMEMYENRIKFFGDDASKPAAAILGDKAYSFLSMKGENAAEVTFPWFEECVTTLQSDADAKYLQQYVNLSCLKFKKDPTYKGQYIANYMKGSEYIDGALDRYQLRYEADTMICKGLKDSDPATKANTPEKAAKDSTLAKQFIDFTKKAKTNIAQQFAESGAADVETLVSVFEPQVEDRKEDADFLNNVSKLLGRSKAGKETDLYFKVSEYSYKLAPTMVSAKGMAQLAMKNKDWDNALKYLDESLSFAVQPEDKADLLLLQANIYYKYKNSFSKARELCRQSINLDHSNADPYIFIADMYRQSGEMCFPGGDHVEKSTVYIAAVDELQKAKSAEPGRVAEINSMIQAYKKAYPAKTDFFKKGLKTGERFHIGGWINTDVVIPD